MEQSRRYRLAMGKECPECERPGFYIAEQDSAGQRVHVCRPGKGGCGHAWPVVPSGAGRRIREGDPTRVMGCGWVDTVMSPLDSIRHQKTLLHAGLMSVDPRSGEVKAWVGTSITSGPNSTTSSSPAVRSDRRSSPSCSHGHPPGARPVHGLPNQKTCIEMPEGRTHGALKTATSPMGKW